MSADRTAALLGPLDRSSRFIEVGASFSPVVSKRDGYNTVVVDHAPREDLAAKYASDPNVDVSRIEEVDVLWQGGALHEAFPPGSDGRFDGLIASHVIEHIPDPVSFLDSAARLLRPEGVLALAVPDRRLCFDCYRPWSTTGQVVAAHLRRPATHAPEALFDSVAYFARPADGRLSWERDATVAPILDSHLEHGLERLRQGAAVGAGYVDAHGWVFTPASFELLVVELGEVGLCDWRIELLEPQPRMEFIARLRRGRSSFASVAERDARRQALLRRILAEQREQADWLLGRPALPSLPLGEAWVGAIEAQIRAIETIAHER